MNQDSETSRRPAPRLGPLPAIAASLATGILLWAGYVDVGWWPLSLVAFAPLFVALDGRPAWSAALLSWLAGFTAMAITTSYIPATLQGYTKLSHGTCFLVALFLLAYQAGAFALAGLLHGLASRRGWPSLLTFLLAFVTTETIWPWLSPALIGASLYKVSLLTQVADLGGSHLVTAVTIAPGAALGLLASDILAKRTMHRFWIVFGLSLPLLSLVYALIRIPMVEKSIETAPTLTVGLLQENAPKVRLPDRDEWIERMQVSETKKMAAKGAQLVVWSEESYRPSVRFSLSAARRQVSGLALRIGVSLVLGMQTRVGHGRRAAIYNSVLAADKDGTFGGRYDKHDLFPFGERMPLGDIFPSLYRWFPHVSRLTPGAAYNGLHVLGHPVAALVCYEDTDAPLIRKLVDATGAQLLVNLTNDAWFAVLPAMRVHLAMATFRAIEHRRYLLRATNTGLTVVVDPLGRIQARARPKTTTSLVTQVRWMKGRTLYQILGDWPWWAALFLLLVGAVLPRRIAKRAWAHLRSKG